MHESATQQYLQAMLAMRTGDGLSFVIEMQSAEISANIDQLIDSTVTLDPATPFLEIGRPLYEANQKLGSAGVEGIEAILEGRPGAETTAMFELDLAFAEWRGAHGRFSTALREAQSAGLAAQSDRADVAVAILVATSVLGVAVLAVAWVLGRRARRREAALQATVEEEKELLHAIVNNLPESIAWKDSELRLMGSNPSMKQRFSDAGIDPPLGRRISDSDSSEAVSALIGQVEALEDEVIRTGQPIKGKKVTFTEASGRTSTLIRSVVPLKRKGKTIGVVSTARDVTEIVDLERSLAAAGRLESIGQLAAGVAHEINTPVQFVSDNTGFLDSSFADVMTAISQMSEVACECNEDRVAKITKECDLEFLLEEIPEALAQSREGLAQIAQIVRAMKDFAHPGGDVGPADVNRLISSTVDVSRNEWKYHADVELELDEELPQPECDEGQIKQALLNMIVNAAHAIADAEPDRGRITIRTEPTNDGVMITIADTGVGMTPEVQERIFERFYTTKEVGRGSGQGLAIAYDAVTSHGGSIDVASRPGAGTRFAITLPLKAPKAG